MDLNYWTEYLKNSGPASIVTFVLGFVVSRLFMTKKESKDYEQKIFENGQDLMQKQNDRFQDFTGALQKYIKRRDDPNIDDFVELSTAGEKYFYQQQITSEAILDGKVDNKLRDNTLIPKIKETIDKSLPRFYVTLKEISDKKGFDYKGKLERKNYESLYLVVEKFGQVDIS